MNSSANSLLSQIPVPTIPVTSSWRCLIAALGCRTSYSFGQPGGQKAGTGVWFTSQAGVFPGLEQPWELQLCPTGLLCGTLLPEVQTGTEHSTLKNLFIIWKTEGAVTCLCVLLYEDLNDAEIRLLSE